MSSSRPVMYFVVYDRAKNISGYTWRIMAHRTSFYIMARYAPLSAVKFSLHGPDPRPTVGPPGFKVVIERQALPGAVDAGGAYMGMPPGQAHRFKGRRINDHATHVLTFRSTWDLFQRDLPSGPPPGNVKNSASGLIVPAPLQMRAADVDVYVSRRRPYWEHEKRARRDNACLGPMSNESGEFLTAVSYRRSQFTYPAPTAAIAPPGRPGSMTTRGLGTALDERGVLWVVEQWMSEDVFTAVDG